MHQQQQVICDHILNFDFGKCEKVLSEAAEGNEKCLGLDQSNVNLGVIGVIRALISRSETDYNLTILQLAEIQKKSKKSFADLTLKLYPSTDHYVIKCLQVLDDPKFLNDSNDESDFRKVYHQRSVNELISAECGLLQIFLKCIFTGEQCNIFSALLTESELSNFRTCFMTLYHAYDRFTQLPPYTSLYLAGEYRSGLLMGWGLCSLLTLLLPSQLSTILGIIGFELASIPEALSLIESASIGNEEGLHSILSKIIILMYNLDVNSDISESKRLVNSIGHPKSALQQYMQAKLCRLEGQSSACIETLGRIRLSHPLIQMPVYWQMIQCFAENQKWPEAIQCIKSLRNCSSAGFPSNIFSFYLEASFTQASTGRTFGPLSVEVQGLLAKVLGAARDKHKAPRPFLDRLAITRARNVLERNEHFFLPHFEIILIWDRLKSINHKESTIAQVRKALESSGQLTLEHQALGWLILAILSDNPATTIKLINNHILPRERALPSANFVSIRAKCELAHCYLQEGKLHDKLLKEIELQCFDVNGFPGQATILLLISKLKIQNQ